MSKNIKLNGTEYKGVSVVNLPVVDGGIASFKDIDEIVNGSVSSSNIKAITKGVFTSEADLIAPGIDGKTAIIEHGLGEIPDLIYWTCGNDFDNTESKALGGIWIRDLPMNLSGGLFENTAITFSILKDATVNGASVAAASSGTMQQRFPVVTETTFNFWNANNAYPVKANVPYTWYAIKFSE